MIEITKKAVFAERKKRPQKIYFQDGTGEPKWIGLSLEKDNPTFTVHMESIKKIFEIQTGLRLRRSSFNRDNYWRYVNEEEVAKIKDWIRDQGTLVYMRDCLSLSVALSINHSPVGLLRHQAKKRKDEVSIHKLADMVEQQVKNLPYYKSANLICSVPSPPGKDFDLPGRIASLVGKGIKKQVITGGFVFGGPKSPVRRVSFEERWQKWKDARISFQNGVFDVSGKKVILIDDMYQSGMTIQYIAMKLQQSQAREVYGFSLIKAVKNTDNVLR